MPLSLKIEQYQRNKLLNGLKAEANTPEQLAVIKILSSLKYIQKFEDDSDDAIAAIRGRTEEEFMKDPLGIQLKKALEEVQGAQDASTFHAQIKFIEETLHQHHMNEPVSINRKLHEDKVKELQALADMESGLRPYLAASTDDESRAKLDKHAKSIKMTRYQMDQMEQMQLDSEAMAKDEVGTLGVQTSVSDAGQLKQA